MSNFFEKGKITLMEFLTIILFCFGALVHILTTSVAMDTIAANQTIRDGDTIVSADENFELGFFSPGNSKNRYLGIWYKKISNGTVVWVANREAPAVNTSGLFKVNSEGVVVLYSGTNTVIWSSNFSSSMRTINPVAKLLDSGNLVIRDESSSDLENFIWQSFDYPGDTFLPGMKLGKDLVTGIERNLTSWKTLDDPSSGMYTIWMDINGYPQIFETKEGSGFDSRLGSWNGLRFSGQPTLRPNPIYTFGFVSNEMEVYYKYELMNSSVRSRMQLRPDGAFQQLIWIDRTQEWVVYLLTVTDICDRYGLCGVYGRCNIDNSPACGCLNGFEPKLLEEWSTGDYSSGCRQSIPLALDCGNGDGFQKFSSLKLPDTRHSWFNFSMTLGECEMECQKNCSCTAYANLDIRQGGSGCLLWFGDLTDIREYPDTGQDLYIRMAYSELLGHKKKGVIKVTLSTIFGVVLLGLTLTVYAWRKKKRPHLKSEAFVKDYTNKSQKEDLELPLFSLSKIVKATNNFSINNKLGEGGFGPVYKGVLEGQEIAVKRLSKTSRQGLDEFKNEVICVAKLQHRNLVKLLGFCIKGDEMMLIYEYMPNKSLDSFIFDETKNLLLDWPQRFHIIHGIARGLLYLHQDSRLRIIHRDLKASNILLDFKMNPKISDFGLARMFREYETEANTNKVVGTLGYISPEYAVNGLFSVKSDIFSFGVLVLEIVSGKKNRGFSHQDHHDNLLGHAWRLNKEGKSLELADVSLGNSWTVSEVLRSIHVGLLCVQQHAEDRPDMSDVVLMLGGEGVLHLPKQPGFFTEVDSTTIMPPASVSVNEVTLTLLDAR